MIKRIILFDSEERQSLLPLTYTRPISDLRIGILTIKEKWQYYFPNSIIEVLTQDYIQYQEPISDTNVETLYINAALLPNSTFIEELNNIEFDMALLYDAKIAAFKSSLSINSLSELNSLFKQKKEKSLASKIHFIKNTWDIFSFNSDEIKNDISLLELKPNGNKLPKHVTCHNPENV